MEKNLIELDVHTHTIASGHAYATLTEMARAGADRGLQILGITEHTNGIQGTCKDIYFANLKAVPRQMFGIQLFLGAELNILDDTGKLSLSPRYIKNLDIRIAGLHKMCYRPGTPRKNTDAVLGAIKNPAVDIISHPDDGKCPLIYEEIVRAAKEYHTLLEVNNNSLRTPTRVGARENTLEFLKLCRRYNVPVIASSDAHFTSDVANLDHALPVLLEAQFPPELVMNYSALKFREFIRRNREGITQW